MKLLSRYFFIALISNACISTTLKAQGASVNFQVFYDNLSPHGYWIDYPNYGYAWVPNVGPDFIPYSTGGYWTMTSYGWTWVSNYSWGWAPFHYGRWSYDSYYGWFWVPDNVWGPAWVAWRTSPGYYGWAPIGPNISITFAMGGGYAPPVDYWCYTSSQYMGQQDISNYYGPRKNTSDFVNTSTVVNNTYTDNRTQTTYIAGPKQEEVEKASGRTINPVSIKEDAKPSQKFENNELKLYRPTITKENSDKVKPTKIADKRDIRPTTERTNAAPDQNINKNAPGRIDKPTPAQKEENIIKEQQQPAKKQPQRIQPIQEQPEKKQVERQAPVQQQPEIQQREQQRQAPVAEPQPIPQQETQKAVSPSEHQINRPVPQNIEVPAPLPPPVQPIPATPPKIENPQPARPVPQQPIQQAPGRPH